MHVWGVVGQWGFGSIGVTDINRTEVKAVPERSVSLDVIDTRMLLAEFVARFLCDVKECSSMNLYIPNISFIKPFFLFQGDYGKIRYLRY